MISRIDMRIYGRENLKNIFLDQFKCGVPQVCALRPLGLILHALFELIIKISTPCNFLTNDQNRSQFCTCHNSWAVEACAKLGPVLTIIVEVTATYIVSRFGSWAHKSFMNVSLVFTKGQVKCVMVWSKPSKQVHRQQGVDHHSWPPHEPHENSLHSIKP